MFRPSEEEERRYLERKAKAEKFYKAKEKRVVLKRQSWYKEENSEKGI